MAPDSASHCRFCRTPFSRVFLDLGLTPLANSYLTDAQLERPEPTYPLKVHVCEACLLVQAQPVVPAEDIFSDYAYFSSFSSTWLDHAARYCGDMRDRLSLTADSFVVEIASNDGYLLKNFVAAGIPCLGVEPAANVAAQAVRQGVPTDVAFFGAETATRLRDAYRPANLMAANNVLAHVPDLNDFVAGFKILLASGGTATVEFPHILELIRDVQFDTIYHEHYSYFSLFTLEKVFAHHGLCLFDAQRLPTHGGSLRIFICHKDDDRAGEAAANLSELRAIEREAGLDGIEGYAGMAARVDAVVTGLKGFLSEVAASGKRVAAWGAAAKGNTLLNVAGVTADHIAFVVDRNPAKQGHYLPGSHVPVVTPQTLFDEKPDYLLILPWNLADEIRAEADAIRGWGGRFVTAIPELRIRD
ncbi:class I SAM-dependent methyltransferase [Asticcacaulis sp. AC402]|uniref:class I SAM-dependent methyltransferase n=1 Tax=Asticcacaulis sp. AC402 TaxID=1282361 RepID=UPI0003C3F46F|nr:class I SAM-dependent methyltransferase [Asticcacaulis sp. AC402]ESQ75341.1 hypothetical protein ABAC402_09555 [Asticcacaulis sp. AC402]